MDGVFEAFGQTLSSVKINDDSIRAYGLMLPTEGGLAEDMDIIDPVGLRDARTAIKKKLAKKFKKEFSEMYQTLTDDMAGKSFEVNSKAIGRRRLRNICLDYICTNKDGDEEVRSGLIRAVHRTISLTPRDSLHFRPLRAQNSLMLTSRQPIACQTRSLP